MGAKEPVPPPEVVDHLTRMGKNFVALGEKLQDVQTPLREIEPLLEACGLDLTFIVRPKGEERPTSPPPPPRKR